MSSCRLCAAADLVRHFEVRGSTLDRCDRCGFVQVRDQPTADQLHAIYGERYFATSKYDDQRAQQRENQRRLGLLAEAGVPDGGRVLDVGCATGDFIHAAGERYDMWGLDVSPFATRVAREHNPRFAAQIHTGFIEDQRFAPGFFDAIVLWDVIEHLWDPRRVIHQLVEHLRPDGTLLLSTPDVGAVAARVLRRRWAFMTPPEHLGFFSTRSLHFLLELDLALRTTSSQAHGKWVNLGFLTYKLGRVFPGLVPRRLVGLVQRSRIGPAMIYVPTADIRYVAARKRAT